MPRERKQVSKGNDKLYLSVLLSLRRNEHGHGTPFEEFFWELALLVESGKEPTPEMVAEELEKFKVAAGRKRAA